MFCLCCICSSSCDLPSPVKSRDWNRSRVDRSSRLAADQSLRTTRSISGSSDMPGSSAYATWRHLAIATTSAEYNPCSPPKCPSELAATFGRKSKDKIISHFYCSILNSTTIIHSKSINRQHQNKQLNINLQYCITRTKFKTTNYVTWCLFKI